MAPESAAGHRAHLKDRRRSAAMTDLATGHLVLYALLIVPVLDWFESRRVRAARVRARRQGRRGQGGGRPGLASGD
jgi:hypothetical protein